MLPIHLHVQIQISDHLPACSKVATHSMLRSCTKLSHKALRCYATASNALIYAEHGDPARVLTLGRRDVAKLERLEVTVEFLAVSSRTHVSKPRDALHVATVLTDGSFSVRETVTP